jgi:arylsulfatase A-like enzyme
MRKPNVIVFFTDQQRHDTTGLHGNPMGLTPNFDRYAREGTHLFNSFTCQPLCGPARSSMQTGRFATQTGCYRNHIPLLEDAETLAKVFGRNGYKTGYIGKWHLGSDDPVSEPERGGYQYWLAANLLEFSSDAYDTCVFDGESRRRKLPGYRVDALTDAAIRFCDQNQDEPFFLFLSSSSTTRTTSTTTRLRAATASCRESGCRRIWKPCGGPRRTISADITEWCAGSTRPSAA